MSTELDSVASIVAETTLADSSTNPSPFFSTLYHVLIRIPYEVVAFLSYTTTATITFNYWTILAFLLLATYGIYFFVRYHILTRYSRLPAPEPAKPIGAPFDLHPDTALDDKQDGSDYPDDFMSVFLSSIKVFGYLDRPVFHELARHLQTRKLKAGEILFGPEDDVRDFYVVVDGTMQVFVKGGDEKRDSEVFQYESDEDSDGGDARKGYVGKDWTGHHLLNEVTRGGTVSSLFGILSVFTEDLDMPPSADGKIHHTTDDENSVQHFKHVAGDMLNAVFPGLRRTESLKAVEQSDGAASGSQSEVADQAVAQETPEVARDKSTLDSNDATVKPETIRKKVAEILHHAQKSKPRSIHPNIVTRAGTDVTLAIIPAEAFQKLTEKFPNSAAHIVQVILTRFQRVTFMTLYKYLGLSKELLKIEKRVNEIAGYGLPQDFFEPGVLDRLRSRMQANRDRIEAAVTDTDTRRDTTKDRENSSTNLLRKATSPRMRRANRSRSKLSEFNYEADVSDSDRDIRSP
ncbi:phosphatidylcholine and lysophosphatidylcholine phospholipase, partial [Rhizophlyctis rosea]